MVILSTHMVCLSTHLQIEVLDVDNYHPYVALLLRYIAMVVENFQPLYSKR